jgi:hypothetical protein
MKPAACLALLFLLTQSVTALDPCQRTWTRIFGSSGFEYFGGIAFATTGTIYVAGRSNSAFDGNTNAGFGDIFLSQLQRDGQRPWTRMWGTPEQEEADDVAGDALGNAYVIGDTKAPFHGQTIVGETDLFLTKYDSNGDLVWTRFRGSDEFDFPGAVCMGTGGLIHAMGYTSGSFDGQTNAAPGLFDVMLCTFSTDGTHVWTRIWGSSASDYAQDVCATPDGVIYVAGYSTGTIDGQVTAGGNDGFLSKLDSAGNREWTRQWGSSDDDNAIGVVADDGEAVYAVGYTLDEFDGQTNAGVYDAFLTKFNSAGDRLWSRIWGGTRADFAYCVGLCPDGAVVVSGTTYGEFDGQTNAGSQDAFISVFSTNGDYLGSCIWGSRQTDQAVEVAVNPNGEVALLGHAYGDFDCQTNNGSADVFVSTFLNVAPPLVDITTTPFWVELPFDTASIAGTNSTGIAAGGVMWWENTSTAAVSGTLVAPVSRAWSVTDIPLTLGTNLISVSASNEYTLCVGDTIEIVLAIAEPTEVAIVLVVLQCGWLLRARRGVRMGQFRG